jgi:beta-mannosidase
VSRRSLDGTVLAAITVRGEVAPRGVATWTLPPSVATPIQPTDELIVAGTEPGRAFWHFAEDVDAMLPAPRWSGRVERVAGGYRLTVTAETFLRDLTVLADRVADDATVDRALVTLLPGEATTFTIETAARVEPETFFHPAVLRNANQLVHDRDAAHILESGGTPR